MSKMSIWGRDFDLDIVYDCYSGEAILPKQEEALKCFFTAEAEINRSKNQVIHYCLDNDRDMIEDECIDNIFRYVVPYSIFVKRDGRVALMCYYKLDMEHGLAVVFKKGKLLEIGRQDCIL